MKLCYKSSCLCSVGDEITLHGNKPVYTSIGFLLLLIVSLVDMFSVALGFFSDVTEVYSEYNLHSMPILCDAFVLLKGTCLRSSSLLILAMSLERFSSLYHPIFYREKVSMEKLVNVSGVCVLFGTISSSLTVYTHGNEYGWCFSPRPEINPIILMANLIESVSVHLIIPSILTLAINFAIVLKLKQRSTNQR